MSDKELYEKEKLIHENTRLELSKYKRMHAELMDGLKIDGDDESLYRDSLRIIVRSHVEHWNIMQHKGLTEKQMDLLSFKLAHDYQFDAAMNGSLNDAINKFSDNFKLYTN